MSSELSDVMRFDSGRQQFGIMNLTVVSDYTYKHVRSHSIQEEIIALTSRWQQNSDELSLQLT